MSLDAGDEEGTLTTRPFSLPGAKLFVNVDAYPDKDQHYFRHVSWREPLIEKYGTRWQEKADEADMMPADLGELRVEVLDGEAEVAAASEPITGDQPRAEVRWRSGDIDRLIGQEVSLRFRMRGGRLYSYWFE